MPNFGLPPVNYGTPAMTLTLQEQQAISKANKAQGVAAQQVVLTELKGLNSKHPTVLSTIKRLENKIQDRFRANPLG